MSDINKSTNHRKDFMNQHVLFQFSIVKNERLFQVILQPGAPWDDIEGVIDEFKSEFNRLKLEAQEKEASSQEQKE